MAFQGSSPDLPTTSLDDKTIKNELCTPLIVKSKQLKKKLRQASFNQKFVEDAPIVIVCCGDLMSWKATGERAQEALNKGNINLSDECEMALKDRIDRAVAAEIHERIPSTLLNVAIAIEHIVLEAVELGLGSCWIRLFDENKIRQLLNLPEQICVVAILPVGVPDEEPAPRSRLPLSDLILQKVQIKNKR
jgi:nitroreductase